MGSYSGYSGYSAYKWSSNRLNVDGWGGIKGVTNDIKNRAEDLKDTADKIRAIMEDLDAGNTLIVNGNHYGQYLEDVAIELEGKYDAICARCDEILAAARSRRSQEDDWGWGYQQYEKEKAAEKTS